MRPSVTRTARYNSRAAATQGDADEVQSVRRRPGDHLDEGQDVHDAGAGVRLERVLDIEAVHRDAERDVAQPQRSLDVYSRSFKTSERDSIVIGRGEQDGDRQHAQRDRGDDQDRRPAPLVGLETARAEPHNATIDTANHTVSGESRHATPIAISASTATTACFKVTRAPR
jgi:hypothetical protein